jgi:hypothetical protein
MEVEPVAAVTVKELNATISSDKNVDTDLVNDALVTHNDAAAEQGAGGDDAVW